MRDDEQGAFRELISQVLAFYNQKISAFAISVWWEACRPFALDAVQHALSRHALDGHLMMMQGLIASFDVLPIHGADHLAGRLDTEGWRILFVWSAQILASGLLLALPLVMTLLCISLALGILNRTAQQLSVFSVGFPVSLLIGLTLLMTLLPQLSPPLTRLFHEALQVMWEVVQALAE